MYCNSARTHTINYFVLYERGAICVCVCVCLCLCVCQIRKRRLERIQASWFSRVGRVWVSILAGLAISGGGAAAPPIHPSRVEWPWAARVDDFSIQEPVFLLDFVEVILYDLSLRDTHACCDWCDYTILYYTILYYTILYYTILYYTILYYTILCYNSNGPRPRQDRCTSNVSTTA